LLIATLCLLEVSARGLLEVELLAILGDEENLMPPKSSDGEESDEKESDEKSKNINLTLLGDFLCGKVCGSFLFLLFLVINLFYLLIYFNLDIVGSRRRKASLTPGGFHRFGFCDLPNFI